MMADIFLVIIIYVSSLIYVFMYFSGFESFAPLGRLCDFAKFWCGEIKMVAVNGLCAK